MFAHPLRPDMFCRSTHFSPWAIAKSAPMATLAAFFVADRHHLPSIFCRCRALCATFMRATHPGNSTSSRSANVTTNSPTSSSVEPALSGNHDPAVTDATGHGCVDPASKAGTSMTACIVTMTTLKPIRPAQASGFRGPRRTAGAGAEKPWTPTTRTCPTPITTAPMCPRWTRAAIPVRRFCGRHRRVPITARPRAERRHDGRTVCSTPPPTMVGSHT